MKSLLKLLHEDIFKPASREEVVARKAKYKSIKVKDFAEDIMRLSKKNKDGSLTVTGDIRLSYTEMDSFKDTGLNIHTVNGSVNVTGCSLKSLEGSPRVINGTFDVSNNSLTSLAGGPDVVTGEYDISSNRIQSLAGCTQKVGSFDCSSLRNLTSLEGGPKSLKGNYSCRNSGIISLKGMPIFIGGSFNCGGCSSLADFSELLNVRINGTLTVPRSSNFDFKNFDWRKIRVRSGVKISEVVNVIERLESDVLRFLRPLFSKVVKGDRDRYDRSSTGGRMMPLQFDKITDNDIKVSEDPATILKGVKAGTYNDFYIFWILTTFNGKEEKMYKQNRRYRNDFEHVKLPFLLASTIGAQIQHCSSEFKMYNHLKTIADFSDLAVMIPTNKFGVEDIRQQRSAAKAGATSLMDPDTIKKNNRERYEELLRNKRASLDFKQISREYIELSTKIALEIYNGTEKLDSYIALSHDSVPRKIDNPQSVAQSMLQWGWRAIDEYNRFTRDIQQSGDDYYKRKTIELTNQMQRALLGLRDKKIGYAQSR